jgi:dihydropteroate synthase
MKIGTYTLQSDRPALMGIVNVTPDSFSDGGRYFDPQAAVEHALSLVEEGADVIDVGGESTRPGSEPVAEDEELRRVMPVIEGIRLQSPVPISIDTTKSRVARRAIGAGANMINDTSAGRFDPAMLDLAAGEDVPICLMHMKGTPRTMQLDPHYDDLIGEIGAFLREVIKRAQARGVRKVIIDPGIGFGKTAQDNVAILRRLDEFAGLGAPVLVGPSRKSFIGKMLGLDIDKRLEATLATLAVAVEGGAQILRVHDVGPARRFLEMYMLCR